MCYVLCAVCCVLCAVCCVLCAVCCVLCVLCLFVLCVFMFSQLAGNDHLDSMCHVCVCVRQYVPYMNAIFAAQKLGVTIDGCNVAGCKLPFLEQACHITHGK